MKEVYDKIYGLYNEILKISMDSPKYFELYKEYIKLLILISSNNPSFNDDVKKYINGNCYSYALDIFNPEGISNVILQLGLNVGYLSRNLVYNGTKEKYLYGLAKDFEELNIDSYEISSDLPNEHGGYKIAFYLSFNDFHFLRQNSDGSWSHKVGYLNRLDKFDTLPNIVNGNYELIKVLEIVKPKVR